MTLKANAAHGQPPEPAQTPLPDEPTDAVMGEVIDRPDGFYWRSADGTREGGPFETAELARVDLETNDAPDTGPGETLQEAQSEIGVADWIDPQTGEPAEGSSPPHLQEE